MAKFKSIQAWLDTNPSKEEVNKVLILIHKGETNKVRRELYSLQGYLRKSNTYIAYLNKIGVKVSEELLLEIEAIKEKISSLQKDLPETKKRVANRKVKVEVVSKEFGE